MNVFLKLRTKEPFPGDNRRSTTNCCGPNILLFPSPSRQILSVCYKEATFGQTLRGLLQLLLLGARILGNYKRVKYSHHFSSPLQITTLRNTSKDRTRLECSLGVYTARINLQGSRMKFRQRKRNPTSRSSSQGYLHITGTEKVDDEKTALNYSSQAGRQFYGSLCLNSPRAKQKREPQGHHSRQQRFLKSNGTSYLPAAYPSA